jgi:hypothetical protein
MKKLMLKIKKWLKTERKINELIEVPKKEKKHLCWKLKNYKKLKEN